MSESVNVQQLKDIKKIVSQLGATTCADSDSAVDLGVPHDKLLLDLTKTLDCNVSGTATGINGQTIVAGNLNLSKDNDTLDCNITGVATGLAGGVQEHHIASGQRFNCDIAGNAVSITGSINGNHIEDDSDITARSVYSSFYAYLPNLHLGASTYGSDLRQSLKFGVPGVVVNDHGVSNLNYRQTETKTWVTWWRIGSESTGTVHYEQKNKFLEDSEFNKGLVIEGWIPGWNSSTNPSASGSHGWDDGDGPAHSSTGGSGIDTAWVRYMDYYYASTTTSVMKTSYWTQVSRYSLLVRGAIVAQGVLTYSDERIKCEIEDVPDDLALDQVRRIPCRYYHYKDLTKRQEHKTIGFIAQEVNEVLPSAITKTTDFIPDHMKPGEVTWEEKDENQEEKDENQEEKYDPYIMSVSNLNEDVVDGTKIRFMCYTGTSAVFKTSAKDNMQQF